MGNSVQNPNASLQGPLPAPLLSPLAGEPAAVGGDPIFPASDCLRGIPIPTVVLDTRGVVLDWNPAAAQLLGWTRDQAVGRVPQFFDAREDDPSGIVLSWLLMGETVVDHAVSLNSRDAGVVRARLCGAPLYDDAGQFFALIICLTPAEATLESKPMPIGAPEHAGILVLDQHQKVAAHNAELCTLFGVPEEVQTVTDATDDQLLRWMRGRLRKPGELDRLFKAAPANRRVTRGQLQLGDGRVMRCVGGPIVVAGGLRGQIWSISDITETARPHRSARTHDRVLRGVVDATNRLLARTNFELGMGEAIRALGQCMEADEVCAFENSIDAATGKTVMSERFNWRAKSDEVRIDDPELQGLTYDGLESWLTELSAGRSIQVWGYGVRDLEARTGRRTEAASSLIVPILLDGICWGFLGVRNLNGGRVWGGLEQSMLSALAGSVSAALVRRRAAADMERAKEAAEAASQAKGTFLAHMSHEIRTPLNGIIGMTDLLLGTSLTDQQGSFAKIAKSSANALLALVNDILDFSKIEAGKIELESLQFDLAACIEDAVEIMLPKAAEKCLEVACCIHPSVPALVRGDSTRLRQVLINLVNNAIKFTDKGEVIVRASLEQDLPEQARIRFAVIDTGIGIPEDRREKLFKPFSQVETSTNRRFGGTGLGLAICRQLAELMGGEIGVESTPGHGSTFWFTAVLDKIAAEDQPHTCPIASDGTPIRVLIVDDHPIQREILHAHLDAFGIVSQSAKDAQEALGLLKLAAADDEPFRVAMIDQTLPDMDGLTLAKTIQNDRALAKTTLVLVAPLDARFDSALLEAHGVSALTTKPIRRSALFDRLSEATSGRPSLRQAERLTNVDADTAPAVPAASATARILLAEDNHVNRLVVHEYLKRAGYACEFAADGEQAVRAVTGAEFDLIFMDCQMPVMDGLEATRRIRQIEAERPASETQPRRIPIVALTANAMKGDREHCLSVGMDAHICKPFDPKELIRVLESYLPESRRARQSVASGAGSASAVAEPPARPILKPAAAQADPAAAADAAAFETLLAGLGGDVGFATQVIDVFLKQADTDMGKIDAGLKAGDVAAVAGAAHSLKGSAGHVAQQGLRELAYMIERAGRANDHKAVNNSVPQLRVLLKGVCDRFQRFGAWASQRSGR